MRHLLGGAFSCTCACTREIRTGYRCAHKPRAQMLASSTRRGGLIRPSGIRQATYLKEVLSKASFCYDEAMKICVTARFKNANKEDIEALCAAVKASGMEDFSFIRDIESYQKIFNDPVELWRRARDEIAKCDALLIDVSDAPTGGRVVEAGIAFGLKLPVFVAAKKGIEYKEVFDGIAAEVIRYSDYRDITSRLATFLKAK